MHLVYTGEPIPTCFSKSLFLAGPSPRQGTGAKSWRPNAIGHLKRQGYDGVVFIPEPRDGKWGKNYYGQIDWEERAMHASDVVLFWIPRDMDKMPALTTNTEFGFWCWLDPARLVVGAPKKAHNVRYQIAHSERSGVPTYTTLGDTIGGALGKLGTGAARTGGEVQVPMHIWNTPSFQSWYQAQRRVGNELHNARVKWVMRVNHKLIIFWALHVDVFVKSENRNKTNEVVLARPDTSMTVAWYRAQGAALEDTQFALVREFRSPASNGDGFVWENPGGSSPGKKDPQAVAVEELHEELGLVIDPSRFVAHGARALLATVSAHRAHVFSVRLTASEMDVVRESERTGTTFGAGDSEITYARVRTLKELLSTHLVDWSTLGMMMTIIAEK